MLVLSRKSNESIQIGDDVRITVLEARGGRIRIGVEAPNHLRIDREEVRRRVNSVRLEAART